VRSTCRGTRIEEANNAGSIVVVGAIPPSDRDGARNGIPREIGGGAEPQAGLPIQLENAVNASGVGYVRRIRVVRIKTGVLRSDLSGTDLVQGEFRHHVWPNRAADDGLTHIGTLN